MLRKIVFLFTHFIAAVQGVPSQIGTIFLERQPLGCLEESNGNRKVLKGLKVYVTYLKLYQLSYVRFITAEDVPKS